jgi:hypothetical protein
LRGWPFAPGDARHLDVSSLDGAAGTAPLGGDQAGLGRSLIEGEHPVLKVLFERLRESLLQFAPRNAAYVLIPLTDYQAVREVFEDERRQRAIRAVATRNAGRRADEVP